MSAPGRGFAGWVGAEGVARRNDATNDAPPTRMSNRVIRGRRRGRFRLRLQSVLYELPDPHTFCVDSGRRDRIIPGSYSLASHRAFYSRCSDAAHGPQATKHSSFHRDRNRLHRPTWARRIGSGPGRSCGRRSRVGLRPRGLLCHGLPTEQRPTLSALRPCQAV